jgi:hypothetical protein
VLQILPTFYSTTDGKFSVTFQESVPRVQQRQVLAIRACRQRGGLPQLSPDPPGVDLMNLRVARKIFGQTLSYIYDEILQQKCACVILKNRTFNKNKKIHKS